MALQHVWTRKTPSTVVTDSFDHPPVRLVYMTS
jgi:hypothetical protein